MNDRLASAAGRASGVRGGTPRGAVQVPLTGGLEYREGLSPGRRGGHGDDPPRAAARRGGLTSAPGTGAEEDGRARHGHRRV